MKLSCKKAWNLVQKLNSNSNESWVIMKKGWATLWGGLRLFRMPSKQPMNMKNKRGCTCWSSRKT
ncbi:hypothetical protein RM541_15105 [Zunongwangia sp. F225]|uniref:Uncharacterized protein n=1 Tax=Autumnicola psychrophila TaxID=3075592 RepID=A0ABU3DVF4_9FLAO|nr:hypothetical protein [Zunongwangia sp. F225]MDT0687696.1 hypothetical protein [Zunongwangia sp. F225]